MEIAIFHTILVEDQGFWPTALCTDQISVINFCIISALPIQQLLVIDGSLQPYCADCIAL